ncbi:hypothetical protein ABQE43_00090 [Mycolicibacter minnesotensis]
MRYAPVARGLLELVVALSAAVGCAVSWWHVRSWVLVAPVIDGEPATTSVEYHPPTLLLTLTLATIAGVAAVLGTARLRRARRTLRQGDPSGKWPEAR